MLEIVMQRNFSPGPSCHTSRNLLFHL